MYKIKLFFWYDDNPMLASKASSTFPGLSGSAECSLIGLPPFIRRNIVNMISKEVNKEFGLKKKSKYHLLKKIKIFLVVFVADKILFNSKSKFK